MAFFFRFHAADPVLAMVNGVRPKPRLTLIRTYTL